MVVFRTRDAGGTVDVNGARVPMLPYEWAYVVGRIGAQPPLSATMYKDEWGRVRLDAVVTEIGRVVINGLGDRFVAPEMEGDSAAANVHPLRSQERAMLAPVMDVILDFKDALHTLC